MNAESENRCEVVCELVWSLFHLNDKETRDRMREGSWKWKGIIDALEPWALEQEWS